MVLSRKEDAKGLIGAALLIKLIHIPAYVTVFIFGLITALMIFMTLPLILMLILFDYVILFTGGMISVFALAKNVKNVKAASIVALICQFFFCADVISLLVLHIVTKKQKQPTHA